MREALDRWKGRNRGSCGYGLWCRVFAAERSTNNGKKRGGGRGRLMTAGDSRGRETERRMKNWKGKRKEGVSGTSRARHPRMNRQFRTANNGKVAICRPFRTRIPFLSPPRIFIYIYMYTYTHAHLKPNCWLIIHSSAVVRFVRVAGSIITGQASVASAQLFDSAALNRSSPLLFFRGRLRSKGERDENDPR